MQRLIGCCAVLSFRAKVTANQRHYTISLELRHQCGIPGVFFFFAGGRDNGSIRSSSLNYFNCSLTSEVRTASNRFTSLLPLLYDFGSAS